MSCNTFTDGQCRVIQLIEPNSTLLTGTSGGGNDPSLDESGITSLSEGQLQVDVNFVAPKANANYRFEYLYVDCLGTVLTLKFTITPSVQTQTKYGFTVGLSGAPPPSGDYVLKWRVIVITLESLSGFDVPESIYELLDTGDPTHTVTFANPRSITTYGFSELRVENLIDDAADQTPIVAQVVEKTLTQFTVALSPSPPNNHYNLVARVP